MSMGILEKNEETLMQYDRQFYELYQTARQKSKGNCTIENSITNKKIICCLRGERKWRLNSIYEPDDAAELYAGRYGKIRDFALICIFGLSDGRAVRRLFENCNETQEVILYEPDAEVFCMAMEYFPLDDILLRKGLKLVVGGINGRELKKILQNTVSYQNHLLMMNCILPNYDVLYTEACQDYIDKMLYYSRMSVFTKNTDVNFAVRFGNNILHNLPYVLRGSSVTSLKEMFAKADLGDVPAIVVSAGPSLDKNIRDLKRAEGKALIIGVDSALKALVREGIHFQMAVSVDPRKNPDVFADERVNRCPFVLAVYSLPLISEKNKNRLFFEDGYGFGAFEQMIAQETGKALGSLQTGGSVATDAFSLAIDLGFKNIVLIGQDLAFTGGRGHVSGFEKSAEADRAHVANSECVEVEAMGGGMIRTDIQMDSYRQWFEQQIEINPSVTVYNATEGGARIRGTVELPLRDVIEHLCTRELDFDRIVADTPQSFTEEEQDKLARELMKAGERLDELERMLQEGIVDYERLIVLDEAGREREPEYRELLGRIGKINQIEADEKYMDLIKLYAKDKEYEVAEDIYQAEELSVKEIAERGKHLLGGYLSGVRACKKEVHEILLPGIRKIMGSR